MGKRVTPRSRRRQSESAKLITVWHEPLEKAADPEGAFGRALVQGAEEWLRRRGGDPEKVPDAIRRDLLCHVEEVISIPTVHQIFHSESVPERRSLVEGLKKSLGEIVENCLLGPPERGLRSGRPPKTSRDSKIFEMKKAGLSHGAIAKRLGIRRLTAQSAYRRELARRRILHEQCREIRSAVERLGIFLQEQEIGAPEGSHKP